MYSDFAIETTETVGTFQKYWNKVKAFIPDLIALPEKIRRLQQEALGWSIKTKNEDLRTQFKGSSTRLSSMHDIAIAVKAKIDKYLPHWKSQEKSFGVSGFGIAPALVIGAVAIGALAYVSVKGLSLLKQYAREKQIISDLKTKAISLEEAKALIKETGKAVAGGTFIDTIIEKIMSPLAIPIMAVGAVGVFILYTKLKRR